MIRALYELLLRLHPPAFRRRFCDEMMSIFDESRAARGSLLLDGSGSLLRQWFFRTGLWKAVLALFGGLGQALFFTMQIVRAHDFRAIGAGGEAITKEGTVLLSLGLAGSLAVLIACITIWNARFQRTRSTRLASRRHGMQHRNQRTC